MNQPDAHDLLVTAHEALLTHLLPALPKGLHYEGRMVASAMLIASRELAQAADCTEVERQAQVRHACRLFVTAAHLQADAADGLDGAIGALDVEQLEDGGVGGGNAHADTLWFSRRRLDTSSIEPR